MKSQKNNLNQNLLDILNGYSAIDKVFIKHLSIRESLYLDVLESRKLEELLKKGVPSEEECLASLHENGLWTKEEEKALNDQRSMVLSLRNTVAKLFIKNQIESITAQLKGEESKMTEMWIKRQSLLSSTAERLSKNYRESEEIRMVVFEDESLSKPVISEDSEFIECENAYNLFSAKFSEASIKECAASVFAAKVISVSSSPMETFGRPTQDLTTIQFVFLKEADKFNKIRSNYNVPDDIYFDAEKIEEFVVKANANEKQLKSGTTEKELSTGRMPIRSPIKAKKLAELQKRGR